MVQPDHRRLRSLASVAQAVSHSTSLFGLLVIAAEEALDAVDAASVSMSRLEVGTGGVRTLVNVGDLGPREERWPEDEVYELEEFANLRGIVEEAALWRVSLDDPAADPQETALLRELGKGSAVGIPLTVDGRRWGELYATRAVGQPGFGPDEIDFLDTLVAILCGAIARYVREQRLSQMAYHDQLTGLFNRRVLDERARQAFTVPPGLVRQVTAVALDINGLKLINDTRGHAAGDHLIRAVGQSLQDAFSRLAGSLVVRAGGDEFVALVVGHAPELVLQVTDELCALSWTFGPATSVSCGAATLRLTAESSETPHDLFAAADQAQYVAKRGRLRRTVVADAVAARVG